MNDNSAGGNHWSFWLIGILALVWSFMGAMNFVWQMNADALASYPKAEQMIINGRPLWATVAFAIAVFGGALGAILILLRKSIAINVLILSLLGVVVTTVHAFSAADLNSFAGLVPQLSAILVAAFLVWYAKLANNKNWLN